MVSLKTVVLMMLIFVEIVTKPLGMWLHKQDLAVIC